ncbi:IS3 family transposase, partial [Spartinivicinus poritis]
VKIKAKYKITTDSKHEQPIADNILDRQFNVSAANKVWTTDITYVWTNQGWLYLAIVVDLYSRQIIGWSVQDHMRTQLCLDALTMAWQRRLPAHGIIHHSDRGSQYASEEYRNQLKRYNMTQSMSRKGNCWDNSPTERVFRTLKSEWLHRFRFQTKHEARQAIWDYITYYNSERKHSALNYQTPMEFERAHQLKKAS